MMGIVTRIDPSVSTYNQSQHHGAASIGGKSSGGEGARSFEDHIQKATSESDTVVSQALTPAIGKNPILSPHQYAINPVQQARLAQATYTRSSSKGVMEPGVKTEG